MITLDPYDAFKATWRTKSTKQLERELASWSAYMAKHASAYAWHGNRMTPPGAIADGDKVSALRELLAERNTPPVPTTGRTHE